ncbi:Uncharacterised protein [Vibrio cholerae]|nr:Uncharacterised protein [Vibrio cholerae]
MFEKYIRYDFNQIRKCCSLNSVTSLHFYTIIIGYR